jgi:pSer/pThr/pTyr-binding forkhead associated (FHA) protein/ribosomal protein L40E
MLTCFQCGGVVADGAAFCQRCGSPVGGSSPIGSALICSSCGNRNPLDTNFCFACGRRLGHTTPMNADASAALAAAVAARPAVSAPARVGNPRLVAVRRDGSDGESYAITGEQLDIGRTDGDLRFDDKHLAERHARISFRAGQYVITPLEARNGVYVRITAPVELSEGSYILIGKQVLRFEEVPDAEKTLRPAVEHGMILFGTPLKSPWGRLRQITAAGTSRDVYHLTRSDLIIGREQGDIVFSDDEFMSRRHALLQFRGNRAMISDQGSSNGTYVRLTGQHVLEPGQMIRLGDELLRFEPG